MAMLPARYSKRNLTRAGPPHAIVTVTVPKSEAARSRRIEITDGHWPPRAPYTSAPCREHAAHSSGGLEMKVLLWAAVLVAAPEDWAAGQGRSGHEEERSWMGTRPRRRRARSTWVATSP